MLADKPVVATAQATYVVFASDAQYAPAVQLISLLTAEPFKVRALKRLNKASVSSTEWLNINAVSSEVLQDYFQGAEAAITFITPMDFFDVLQLTRSLLEVAAKAGVRRFAWVAPACPPGTELSDRLAEAANLVQASGLETLVLDHAPYFLICSIRKRNCGFVAPYLCHWAIAVCPGWPQKPLPPDSISGCRGS